MKSMTSEPHPIPSGQRTDGWRLCRPPAGQTLGPIERLERLIPEQFYEEFLERKPVIYTDVVRHWPAAGRWSPQMLAQTCGELGVFLRRHREKSGQTFFEQCIW